MIEQNDTSFHYIFGPVPSRRLGRSLGISIIPEKFCSMDCVYCEVGKTTSLTAIRAPFAEPEAVFAEFDALYPSIKQSLDVVTITGAGEPTLNTRLPEIINGLRARSEHPLAILTNSTHLHVPEVYQALLGLDIVVPSLDAVSEAPFQAVNRPADGVSLESIIEHLIRFSHAFTGKLFIEVLLVKGVNDQPEELEKIAEILNKCSYTMVQLNTVFRPPAYAGFAALTEAELIQAYLFLKERGVQVEPVGNFIKGFSDLADAHLDERILRLVSMRPCTASDIAAVFGADQHDVEQALTALLAARKLQEQHHSGAVFYFKK